MAGIGWRRESHCGVARDGHPVYKPAVATVVVILVMVAAVVVKVVMETTVVVESIECVHGQ